MAGHLGVNSPGDPATSRSPRQLTAVSCRGQKNSSASPDGEQMTARCKGLMKVCPDFHMQAPQSIDCAHFSKPREAEEQDKSTQDPSFPFTWKMREHVQKNPGTVAEHVSTVEPSVAPEEYPTKVNCSNLSLRFTGTSTTITCTWNVRHSEVELDLRHHQKHEQQGL